MFTGEIKEVELIVDNDLIGVMIDRFGKKISVIPIDENRFKILVKVAFSPQFIGWILSLGDKVKIINPLDAVEKVTTIVNTLHSIYS